MNDEWERVMLLSQDALLHMKQLIAFRHIFSHTCSKGFSGKVGNGSTKDSCQ